MLGIQDNFRQLIQDLLVVYVTNVYINRLCMIYVMIYVMRKKNSIYFLCQYEIHTYFINPKEFYPKILRNTIENIFFKYISFSII